MRNGLKPLDVRDVCVVTSQVLVDDGVLTPDGFKDLEQLRLGSVGPWKADADRSEALAKALECATVMGATVSASAGVDSLSQANGLRSGAQVESMEGAAVAAVCQAFEVPYVELRAVSNRTGNRDLGGWDLDGALDGLTQALARALDSGALPS